MDSTLILRLSAPLRERLDRLAMRRGDATEILASQLIDEGLRMAEFPGITFKDSAASGRVPTVVHGPEVAVVIDVLSGLEATGDERVAETAEWLSIGPTEVELAMSYCAAFPDEIAHRIRTRGGDPGSVLGAVP
jgi:predicted transcriptional regulator